jgi:hypothetical protein
VGGGGRGVVGPTINILFVVLFFMLEIPTDLFKKAAF